MLNRGSFTLHYLIGKGGFSKVWSVELKKTHKKYAMKEMLKTKYPSTYLESLRRTASTRS